MYAVDGWIIKSGNRNPGLQQQGGLWAPQQPFIWRDAEFPVAAWGPWLFQSAQAFGKSEGLIYTHHTCGSKWIGPPGLPSCQQLTLYECFIHQQISLRAATFFLHGKMGIKQRKWRETFLFFFQFSECTVKDICESKSGTGACEAAMILTHSVIPVFSP